jgi:pantoate--beta-alanine ligase
VDPGPAGDELEGRMRPGHFRGMLTVVLKLLNLTRPAWSVYGEKDYQQLVLIRRMVATFDVPVTVVGSPTIREEDGLALSSRNVYLTGDERVRAAAIPRALDAAVDTAAQGAPGGEVVAAALAVIRNEAGAEPDYVVLTDPELGAAPDSGDARLLLAVRIGTPRLLDNAAIRLEPR